MHVVDNVCRRLDGHHRRAERASKGTNNLAAVSVVLQLGGLCGAQGLIWTILDLKTESPSVFSL